MKFRTTFSHLLLLDTQYVTSKIKILDSTAHHAVHQYDIVHNIYYIPYHTTYTYHTKYHTAHLISHAPHT
jgi:hypothetical protein